MKEDDDMIRKIFILTTMIMLISITAVAEDHNYIYKSDIRTYIDNQEITSYNIGGKTLVKATDMRRYGFEVEWDEENRTVVIRCLSLPKEQPSLSNYEFEGMYKNSNDILGETVTTDIDVYFGTHRVTSYNTGGNMMICVEEMAETIEGEHYFNENAKMGYSDLGFKMVYDDEQRRLDLYSMRQGVSVNTLYGVGKIIGSSSRMWEFYGYYRNRNISDDEYINYSEKDIVGDSYVFYSCDELFKYAGISYTIQDGKLCITFPDNYVPVKPERWSATNHSKDTSFTPIYEVNANINSVNRTIKIMIMSDKLYIADNDMIDIGLIISS